MKKIICAALLFASFPVFAGQLSDKDAQNILSAEDTLDGFCRGWSGDKPETQKACIARDKLVAVLKNNDWCHGKKGQAEYQKTWHKCTNDSEK